VERIGLRFQICQLKGFLLFPNRPVWCLPFYLIALFAVSMYLKHLGKIYEIIWNPQQSCIIQSRLPRRWSPNLFSHKSIIDLGVESLLSGADSCLYSNFSVDYIVMCVHGIYYLYRNSARKNLQLPKALDWLIPLSFAVVFLPCESHHLKSFSLKSHLFRLMKWFDMISVVILELCVSSHLSSLFIYT